MLSAHGSHYKRSNCPQRATNCRSVFSALFAFFAVISIIFLPRNIPAGLFAVPCIQCIPWLIPSFRLHFFASQLENALKVIALQFDIVWENKPVNFETVHRLLKAAAPEPRSLAVLPEMFASGFSMNTAAVAEAYGGPTEQFLAQTAREFSIFLMAGAAMSGRDGSTRNKALVFSPAGELLAYYAKMRPFTPGGELEHYTPGERPTNFRWEDCSVSPFVCYDLRFPELFRAATATHRPELFTVIASWPDKRIHHWVTLLQARAIENQAYVVGVNRIGDDPYYRYAGRSLIVSPQGEILADAGGSEGWISAELDLAALRKYRTGLPFLYDLRPVRVG
jgi:omega-amidase